MEGRQIALFPFAQMIVVLLVNHKPEKIKNHRKNGE
jgi:hypothetical protein